MDLTELLKTETDRIEWKVSPHANDVPHAVCALANDLGNSGQPAVVVLGVDHTGSIIGIDLSGTTIDEQQQRLAGRLSSIRMFPTPSFTIETADVGGRVLLLVRVHPYPVPPIVTVDGTAWIRRGTTTMRASEADLARLRERRPERHQPFDLRAVPGTTIADLNLSAIERRHDAARLEASQPDLFPSIESWLTQRQLGRPVAGVWTPNAAALLIFGRSPQDHFPGARVEFVRYGGTDVDGPVIERASVTGSLADQVEGLWARISAQLVSVPAHDTGAITAYHPTYPLGALRELVRNLIQHRSYEGTHAPARIEWFDDRIEFSNPGGPFGRASEGEFGTHSDYRNPVITSWLAELGYVEQLGRGIRLVRLALAKNGNPGIEVETDGFTRVAVRRAP